MVHNGVEYGIMQAYAEGFNILHHGDLGAQYVKEGDAEVGSDGGSERLSATILIVLRWAELWRRGSVVGSWLLGSYR